MMVLLSVAAFAGYYTPDEDEVITLNKVYLSSATDAGYSVHAAVAWAGTATTTPRVAGDPANDGAATSGEVNCYSIKNNGKGKNISLSVAGCSKVIIYHESHASRYVLAKLTPSEGDASSVSGSVSTYFTEVPLDGAKSYSIALQGTQDGSDQQDFYVYAVKLIAATEADSPIKTFYCKVAQDWWNDGGAAVAAHYWKEGGESTTWPGVRMSTVDGEPGMWQIGIDTTKYEKVIFSRVNGSGDLEEWGAQTANLPFPTNGDNCYTITTSSNCWSGEGCTCTGAWSKYTPPVVEDVTLYFVNNLNWAICNAHPYVGSISYKDWPGKAMKETTDVWNEDYTIYSITFPETYTSIVFNSGNGADQTANLEWSKDKPYFVPGAKNGEGKYTGKWYATIADIPVPSTKLTVNVPAKTDSVFVAGSWDAWKAFHKMALVDGETDQYTLTINADKELLEYKYLAGPLWAYVEVRENGANRTYAALDEVSAWTEVPDGQMLRKFPKGTMDFKEYAWGEDVGRNKASYDANRYIMMYSQGNNIQINKTNGLQIGNSTSPSAFVFRAGEAADISVDLVRYSSDVTVALYYMGESTDVLAKDNLETAGTLCDQVNLSESNSTATLTKKGGAAGFYKVVSSLRFYVPSITLSDPTPNYYIIGEGEAFGNWSFVPVYGETFEIENLAAGDYMFRLAMKAGDWSTDYGYDQLTEKPEGVTKNNDNNICFTYKKRNIQR